MILDAESAIVACSTFLLNVILAVFLARRRIFVDQNENKRWACGLGGKNFGLTFRNGQKDPERESEKS